MHDNSEWNRSVHRNNYWRPSQGLYLPNTDRTREPNGRSTAQGFSRYSDNYRHRHTDQRSHDFKWHSYPRSPYQGTYSQSFGAAIQPSIPMAPRHRKRKGRDRGGSRPFPSKLVEKIADDSTAASTVSSSSSYTSSSHNKHSASTVSSTKHISSSLSSHKFLGTNPSSRPDDNGSRGGESSKQESSLNVKLHAANVPTRPPVSSSGTISKSSTSSSSTAVSTAASTSSSLSSLSSSTELPKSLPNIAQTYSVSVSSNNLPKVKILKHSSPGTLKPIPMSTLAYCESIPHLKDILHKRPVVMLEKLTEKLIRMKLKHNGLCLKGNWRSMLHKQRKKKTDNQKKEDKIQKKKSLKLILSMNSKGMIDKKKNKLKKDHSNHKNNNSEFLNSENILDTRDSKTSSSLLVDPKVMSLSRPLQSAYSNNASMTKMPFKHSGRVINPSKTFHPKPTGPMPKHMQMFDLDKLRTKLKGANFGGSGRKPGPFLNTHLDMHNTEMLRSSEDVPVLISKFSASSSDTTDIISPMSGLDDNMIVRSDVREDMITDDASVGSDSEHSCHSDIHAESNIGKEIAADEEHIDTQNTDHKGNEVSCECVIDKCAADSSGDATDFHNPEDHDQSVGDSSGPSDSWLVEEPVVPTEPELSSVPTLVPETERKSVVDSAKDISDLMSKSADGLEEKGSSIEIGEVEGDVSDMHQESELKDIIDNEVDSSLQPDDDSPMDKKECSLEEKDDYFPDKIKLVSLDKAEVTDNDVIDSTVPVDNSGTISADNDKETLFETRSVDCNLQISDGMAKDTSSSLEQQCSVSKDSNDNVMLVNNDDRSHEIGSPSESVCEKEELSSQQSVPLTSQEREPVLYDHEANSASGTLVNNAVKSPHSLTDICHGFLKKQDMHFRLPSSEGNVDTEATKVKVDRENASATSLENPDTNLNNGERESNSQCLTDKSNKDAMAVDLRSDVAIDLSSSRTDDDLSPVCIISSVESGAHIYFSESDSDLKPNTKTDEQKEMQMSGQTSLATSSQSQSITSETIVTNTASSTAIIPNTGQSRHDTITPTSSGVQDFFSAGLVSNSYPVIVTSSIPVYPIPDVSSVIQPILLTSQNTDLARQSAPMPTTKESKLASKPRPIRPKGTEPNSFVQMPVPKVPSFPMFLPTIPSAFPPETHNDNTPNDGYTVDIHLSGSTQTMQNKHEHSDNIADTNKQATAATAEVSDHPTSDIIDASDSHSLTEPEEVQTLNSNPIVQEAPMFSDGTLINDKALSPDMINNDVCQKLMTQGQMARVVSDLDVMHYDDEPPVLETVNNSDYWVIGEPSQLTKIQPVGSDAPTNLSEQDLQQTEALSESTTSVVSEYHSSESSANNSTNPSNNEATEHCIKSQFETCGQVSQERVEVGRLNLRRAHTEDSDDSDATLIYSCDEENTYFEEIFQEPEGPTWPRNAPWTDNEDDKNPLYEGKLVIVSDVPEDRDGESTSDTNTSNERLSLIITTLRKDLEEKKTDRRQAEKEGEKDKEDVTPSTKVSKGKGKRKKPVKPRKRATIRSLDSSVPKEAEGTPRMKKSTSKHRKTLIVTIQRRNISKSTTTSETSENVPEVQATAAETDAKANVKGNPRKVKKTRRKIKRRLTAKRRKKKVLAPSVETIADEDIAKEEAKETEEKKPVSKPRRTMTQKRRVTKQGRRKKMTEATTVKEEIEPEEKVEKTDSDDSDELPTILPPKRRRLQKNGNPLMMMQNTVGGKGNSSERIMREFPRHNWLEHKINQLQQQTTCSPSEEELVAANTVHQSPTHVCDSQPSSEPVQTESLHKQDSDPVDERYDDHPVPSESPSSIKDGSPVAPAAGSCVGSHQDGEKNTQHSPNATDGSNQNSFSLHEALEMVGAEDKEGGELVIDERGTEQDASVIDTPETEHKSGKEDDTQVEAVKESPSPELTSALSESTQQSQPTVDKSTLKSDATEAKPTGQPLDLCVRKNDKPSGGCARPKAPPVQMVLPQVQQPARPVSTDPALVKETKEILQAVVTEPPESNTTTKEKTTLTEGALNLTQALSQTPVSLAEMARGIVMPVGMQKHSSALQQATDSDELSQQSQTLSVAPSSQVSVGELAGPQLRNPEPSSATSPVSLSKPNSGISTVVPSPYCPTFASNSPVVDGHSVSRPTGSTMVHPVSQMQGPVPGLVPAHGRQHPNHPFPRHGHQPRNMEGKDLDKEFEKHFREFKQLEILAAKKEREREALLQMKKRKAMLLREMKMLKSQQNTPHENENSSHLQGQIFKPPVSNTQHRAQVAELRPFQGTPQGRACFQKTDPDPQNTHPVYSVPPPLSQTATSPSGNFSTTPLNLVGVGHRKRGISSEDRRPIVEMINLAMLQRSRSKHRRLSEEQRTGPPGSNAVPTPAHQKKSDVIVILDSDVPSSEITRSPYVKRKTPIHEPPSSVNRCALSSVALVPAHSQPPFQTAGSLIVPAKTAPQDQIPSSFVPPNPHGSGNTAAPGPHSSALHHPQPVTGVHRTPTVNEIQSDHSTKSRNSSESNYNVSHVPQDQPVSYHPQGERMMSNMHPSAFVVDHGSVQQQQWSPRMPNPMSQNHLYASHQGFPGNQPMRPTALHSVHQPTNVRPQIAHGMRHDRGMEVIDLTKEPQISKPDMQRHIPGNQLMAGGNEPPSGPKDETESTVQRELTAALARRQGTGFEQQPQQQPQQLPQQMVRRETIPNIAHYGQKPYPGHNPVSPQGVPQGQHPSSLYPRQVHAHAGNPMSSLTDAPYAPMQGRQSTAGTQYRMQEPTSVKSALLSSGPKQMMSASNYPMNTSAQTASYATPQYQQRNTDKVPQQMVNAPPMVESYQRMPEKGSIMPGQVPHQQPQSSYADHLNRGGPPLTNQYKPPQQPMTWRPQVPTSVSNVPMTLEKQQHMMMMARKNQWQHYSQAQKYPMPQKGANPTMTSSGPSHAMQAGVPQSGGSNYAMAPSSQNQEHSMHMRAALHNMRMMQRGPAPGSGPVPGPMQAKMQQTMQQGYPRESGMLIPGQGAAPALIEFQEQDNQRRMQQVAMTQPPPRLHQFNGSCVVCGSLAMYLCSSCRMVWYCSQTCQNNHWKRHGPECKPIKAGLPGQL